ncbi:hypothetical protein [Methylobacterium nodulans]|uniref:Uncharacterized protein n=1 Tax=Methylobacterium nodulans (strain LMG 21967 / CNCM I-2342 / ORS 2060) TaxID=460265 RepID=B8ILY7_METNO|nr:hypothetical protein [Methylobacterium nodulans]ACL56331.1 conserved hypothetical protein [Methylobacterium nodulans ORS 2060]
MTVRVATILSALALAAPLAAAAPAQASPCRGLSPEGCARVSLLRETRRTQLAFADEVYAPYAWRRWVPAEARPFTRFDIEGIRLMTRMP